MGASLPQSERRRSRRRQYPVDSADSGAGGYRLGSFRESETSGGSGNVRVGKHPDGEQQQQREYQQQPQHHIRHNDGVTNNENLAAYAPLRASRRQPQQQRQSETYRTSSHRTSLSQSLPERPGSLNRQDRSRQQREHGTSLSSSYTAQGIDHPNQSIPDRRGSLHNIQERSRQRREHDSYDDIAFSSRRQIRAHNKYSQSLTKSNSLQTNKQEEGDHDDFDEIPLLSREYLDELTLRSSQVRTLDDFQMNESDTNRLNPNNSYNHIDDENLFQDSEFSLLSQNEKLAALMSNRNSIHTRRSSQASSTDRMSNGNEEILHSRRSSQASSTDRMSNDSRGSFLSRRRTSLASSRNSLESEPGKGRKSAYLSDQLDKNDKREQLQQQRSNRTISSSLNENQLRQNRGSNPELSSPLFHSFSLGQSCQSTGDFADSRGNFDIRGSPFRQSDIGPSGYDNRILTNDRQGVVPLNKNPPESMLALAQRPMDKMNGSNEKESGFVGSVAVGSLNSGNSGSLVKRRKKRRLLCVIGICLVAVIVIVVVIVYITTYQSSDDRANQIQPQVPIAENDADILLECEDCISKPVSDIEGRCSSSNLPGSLSACKEACAEAACCYSNVEGEKCYDDSNEATLLACGQYKPHCDVIHRPWPGSSKGLIPKAPTSLFEGSDWDEICGSGSSARELSTSNSSQALTCIEFCLPSKCCFAPMVQTDLTSQGLLLNNDGSYQSIETDEYIMTSCAQKNYKACSEYADACRDLIMPLSFWMDSGNFDLSVISFPPSTSITPSASTRLPTLQPTTETPTTQTPTKEVVASLPPGKFDRPTREPTRQPTREPTRLPTPLPSVKVTTMALTTPPTILPPVAPTVVVPIADLEKIRDSCTGVQNYNLIARGEFNARTKCHNACNDGLCCYKDLGLGIEKSCFEGNEDVCALYSDCLVLKAKPNDVLPTDTNTTGPSTPTDDLADRCSLEAIGSPEGISNCFEACLPGSWCCGATGESSCFNEYEETCAGYGQCLLMVDAYGGDSNQALPPIPPSNLQSACSYSALSAFHQSDGNIITECNQMCEAGMCCMDGSCGEGTAATELAIADRCAAYEPCRHLLQLSTPPDDMETVCEDKESPQCLDACSAASCCWNSNDDNCFASFEDSCLSYAPYCSPNMNGTGDFPEPPSPPPPGLCMKGPPSACRNACRSGPSCCFTPSIEDNCFSQNEETCGMWTKCAPFYQEDVELV